MLKNKNKSWRHYKPQPSEFIQVSSSNQTLSDVILCSTEFHSLPAGRSGFRFAPTARPIGTLRLLAGPTSSPSLFTALPPSPLHRPTAVIASPPPHIPLSTYPRFAGHALRVYSRPPDNNTPFPTRDSRDRYREHPRTTRSPLSVCVRSLSPE